MANTLGPSTWQRCATHLADGKAKAYELSHLRSNTMPQSPFGVPLREKYRPTVGIAGTRHAFNGEEIVSGEPGAQGTQMDAIGHFAVLPEAWDGKGEFPADRPLTPADLLATVYHVLHIDPHQSFTDNAGRPIPILDTGTPIAEII